MTASPPKPDTVIANLWEADFGAPAENLLRYVLITVLGVMLWRVAGIPEIPFWIAAYALTEALYFHAVRPRTGPATHAAALRAQGLYLLTALCFVSLPLVMVHDDRPLIVAASLFAQLGILIYILWRIHRLLSVVIFDCVLISIFATNTVAAFWDMFPEPLHRAIFAGLIFSVSSYAMMAILRSLRQQREIERAATRSLEADRKETIARMTGGIAHDFNNILTVILGNLELYRLSDSQEDRDGLIDEASDAATRGAYLISQLLAYSRRAPMAPESAPLREHVFATTPLLTRLLPKNIALELDLNDDAGNVSVDRAQFTAALLNLVSNAADAIGAASGRVLIAGWPLYGAQGRRDVVLAVSDTGQGIPADIAERVLEPYFSTKGATEGSGLGLSMVKGFAEQSGGRLELHNRPGQGLTVTMILPMDTPEHATPDSAARRAETPARDTPHAKAGCTDLPT